MNSSDAKESPDLYATPQERAQIHALLNHLQVQSNYRSHYWDLLRKGVLNTQSLLDLIEARESLRP